MPFSKFQEVEEIFSSEGIYKIYVRELQEKQDNTKNQIYFGTGSVLNLLPCEIKKGSESISKSKKKSFSKSGLYLGCNVGTEFGKLKF